MRLMVPLDLVWLVTVITANANPCPDALDAIYRDMYSGDEKQVTIKGDSMTIKAIGANQSWEVNANFSRQSPFWCSAEVDFPSASPLRAKLWTLYGVGLSANNGTELVRKTAYQFLAASASPDIVNQWSQINSVAVPGWPVGVEPCGNFVKFIDGVYADMRDGDKKQVTFDYGSSTMTITPWGNNQTWVVRAVVDPKSCSASIDFNVPGKPRPPPVALIGSMWSSTAPNIFGEMTLQRAIIEFTDPSGTLGAHDRTLNSWVQVVPGGSGIIIA